MLRATVSVVLPGAKPTTMLMGLGLAASWAIASVLVGPAVSTTRTVAMLILVTVVAAFIETAPPGTPAH